MAFNADELRAKQRKQWGMVSEKAEPKAAEKQVVAVKVRKPNKYLNIARRDIEYLACILTRGEYDRWKQQREIYRDFMEQHFGRKEV